MRKAWIFFLGVWAAGASFAACVSDAPDAGSSDDGGGGGGDATTSDGAAGDGSSGGDGSTPSDAGVDSGPKCGYLGEACCTPPQLVCNQGSSCVSGACRVNDVWALGHYPGYPDFVDNVGASIHFDGTSWTKGGELPLHSGAGGNGFATGAYAFTPAVYQATINVGYIEELVSPTLWETCGSPTSCYAGPGPTLQAIYGFGVSDYWVGGTNIMIHCGSSSCAPATTGLPGSFGGVSNFSGPSSSDLWFTQTTTAYHYSGAVWTAYSGLSANAIAELGPNDVWVGGDGDLLQHFDGTSWGSALQITQPDGGVPGNIYYMSASGPDDLWAAGKSTTGTGESFTLHFDGTSWSYVPLPPATSDVASVLAAGKNDAFVTAGETILRWNGTAWTPMTTPPQSDFPDAAFAAPAWDVLATSARQRP